MSLLVRGLRRLEYELGLNRPFAVIHDLGREAAFLLSMKKRARLREFLAGSPHPDDLLEFATQQFGPQQIRTEILGFLAFASVRAPRHVLEIGTASGGTNFLLGRCLDTVTLRVGVDRYVQNRLRLRQLAPERQEVLLFNGSSYAPRTVKRVASALGGRRLDLLFIDGDHRYDGVRRDFLEYRQLVRDGGLIAFHDIVPDHLSRFGVQSGSWVGDVPVLWKRLRGAYPFWEFVANPEQNGFGIGVLQYSSAVPLPTSL